MTDAAFPTGTILGYPRIGRRRELKRAVESHWAGATTEAELEQAAAGLRRATRERLAALGLGRVDATRLLRLGSQQRRGGHPGSRRERQHRGRGVSREVDRLRRAPPTTTTAASTAGFSAEAEPSR